jgi:hypothetical protein
LAANVFDRKYNDGACSSELETREKKRFLSALSSSSAEAQNPRQAALHHFRAPNGRRQPCRFYRTLAAGEIDTDENLEGLIALQTTNNRQQQQ